MRKIAIYPRVSTEEQAKVEEGSIKNQIESLKKYIQGENLKHDDKWGELVGVYPDEGYSAKSLQRPGIKKLLLDIYRRVVDTVIITEISRLSRSVEDWIHLRRFFEEHDASFIATRQNFDTSTAMGRAMLSFAIEFSQLERELTAERVKASYIARAGRGLWTGGPIPFGLEKGEKNGHLNVSPVKQIIAGEIFNIVIHKARNIATAVEIVNQAGYYRENGKPWDLKTLPTWIRHPALIGEVHMNRETKDEDQERKPEGDRFKVVPAVWDPVVEKETWLSANRILDERYGDLKVGNWKHHDFFLSKILLCPQGKRLTGASGTGGNGTKYSHYRHSGNIDCPCHVRTIPAGKIEAKVLEELRKLLLQPNLLAELAKNSNSKYCKALPNFATAISEFTQKCAKLDAKVDQITDQILDATDSHQKAIWNGKLQRIQTERMGYEKQIESLKTRQRTFQYQQLDHKNIELALKKLMANFETLSGRSKHLMISSIVDRVDINKDAIVIAIKNPQNQLGVNQGTQLFYSKDEWLLRTDSNRRPGG